MTNSNIKTDMSEARRQGQFEGQVLATLSDIKKSLDAVVASNVALDARLRMAETQLVKHDDQFKDVVIAHQDLYAKMDSMAKILQTLTDYQNKQAGFKSASTWIAGVASAIFTALFIYVVTHLKSFGL